MPRHSGLSLQTQKATAKIKEDNLGQYVEIDVSSQNHPGRFLVINKDDWDYLVGKNYLPIKIQPCTKGYIFAFVFKTINGESKRRPITRLLFPNSSKVMFLDGNTLNLRRHNLKPFNKSQQNQTLESLEAQIESASGQQDRKQSPYSKKQFRKVKDIIPKIVSPDNEFLKETARRLWNLSSAQKMILGKMLQDQAEAETEKTNDLFQTILSQVPK